MPIAKLKQFLFGSGSMLSQLSSAAASHQALLCRVSQSLPETLASHCIAASIDGGILTVVTDSASWATQLRFSEQAILSGLSSGDPSSKTVCRLSVQVRAGQENPSPANNPHPNEKISAQSRTTINSCADSITDKSLSDALRRLSRRVATKPDQPE